MARDGNLSSHAKVVYLGIKTHCPDPFPSINTLIKYTGLSKSSVIRAIKELEQKLYLGVEREEGRPNVYTLRYFPDAQDKTGVKFDTGQSGTSIVPDTTPVSV